MLLGLLLSLSSGLALTPRLVLRAARPPRCAPPALVSERHNQAYKETIKLFEPLAPDAPLRRVPLASHVPHPDGDCLIHTTTEPLLSAAECVGCLAARQAVRGRTAAAHVVDGGQQHVVARSREKKESYNKTPSHNTGHGTGAHWH